MQNLTKAEEAELRFLRNEVDKYVVEEGRLLMTSKRQERSSKSET